MIHALADTAHFAEDGGRSQLGDDQFSRASGAKGLHSSFLDEKQPLAAFAGSEENIARAKVAQFTALFERSQTGDGKVLEEIDRGERGGFNQAFGRIGVSARHDENSRSSPLSLQGLGKGM